MIPWENLTSTNPPDHLPAQFLPDVSFDDSDKSPPTQWVVWEPRVGELLEHHIVTEEEVYQHHLIGNYASQGHLIEGKVVFALVPLEQTTFLSDINTFWLFWVKHPLMSRSDKPRTMSR